MIKQSYDLIESKKLRTNLSVSVFIGPPGTGKTRYIYDNFDINDIYKLNTPSNGTLWFDGYQQE